MPEPQPVAVDPASAVIAYNARLGMILFILYCLIYGGFMALVGFWPGVIAATPLAGVSLAVLYGFALIIGALLLALLYMVLCRR